MKQINFFALKADILPVLEQFEVDVPIKYVQTGVFDSPNYLVFRYGRTIPNLGIASNASAINCHSYLVSAASDAVNVRNLPMDRFAVDQLINPHTIEFSPGGLWADDILLSGRVGTVSELNSSQFLMKKFKSVLQKTFVTVRAFRVGPNALELLRAGKRLTISAQSPQQFNLSLENR